MDSEFPINSQKLDEFKCKFKQKLKKKRVI